MDEIRVLADSIFAIEKVMQLPVLKMVESTSRNSLDLEPKTLMNSDAESYKRQLSSRATDSKLKAEQNPYVSKDLTEQKTASELGVIREIDSQPTSAITDETPVHHNPYSSRPMDCKNGDNQESQRPITTFQPDLVVVSKEAASIALM